MENGIYGIKGKNKQEEEGRGYCNNTGDIITGVMGGESLKKVPMNRVSWVKKHGADIDRARSVCLRDCTNLFAKGSSLRPLTTHSI